MKNKKTIKTLKLSKEIISSFDKKSIKGGVGMEDDLGLWTGGCTDGCGTNTSFQTAWNCTQEACTKDCGPTATYMPCRC